MDIYEVTPSQLSEDCRNFLQEHFDDEVDDDDEEQDENTPNEGFCTFCPIVAISTLIPNLWRRLVAMFC